MTSNIEHQAVLRSLRALTRMGYRVTSVPVDEHGLVDPADVEKAVTDETISSALCTRTMRSGRSSL